jgi:diguanylate cyclase (GGDEF)-like protein
MTLSRLSATCTYTACGFLFGLAFPLGCLGLLAATGRLATSQGLWALLVQAHADHFLLYVVDSAPIFLALFAGFAGVRQDRIRQFNKNLEQQVADKTRTLWHALEDARQAHETVLHMAHHDALTGLPNRSLLRQRIDQAISQARCSGHRAALVFFDLDKFKDVNDSLGHEAGDSLLREVAQRLSRCVRSDDTVARLGGDEFVIVLANLHDTGDVQTVMQKLLAAVAEPMTIADRRLVVTASIGLSIFPEHGDNGDDLMRASDRAMYQAKTEGRNTVQVFDPAAQAGAHGDKRASAATPA